jgi:hypothetical protein
MFTKIVEIDIPARDGVFANSPWQVVVAIDERGLAQNSFSPSEINIFGWGRTRLGAERTRGPDEEQDAECAVQSV